MSHQEKIVFLPEWESPPKAERRNLFFQIWDKIVKTHYAFWERILPRARFWNRSEKHYLTKNKIFGFWREIICWEKQFFEFKKKMGNCCKCLQKDDDEERLIGDDSDSGLLLFLKTGLFSNSVSWDLLEVDSIWERKYQFIIKFIFWPGQV